jgi:hypothetical protein
MELWGMNAKSVAHIFDELDIEAIYKLCKRFSET